MFILRQNLDGYALQVRMKPGTERNQSGRALVKIDYMALSVPKFTSLFSIVLLYLMVFLH